MSVKEITAIIPARGGSKGVPKKNIYLVGGFPLIAYSIAVAKLSNKINRIIVSTDDDEIANIAKKFGAEVPFLRPAKYAMDTSTDREFVVHALRWLEENEGKIPDYLVHLRPTTPLRDPEHIDEAIEKIITNENASSLRSGYEIRESPYKLFSVKDDFFVGLFPDDPRPEYYNLPRQAFPAVYQPDGYVDIIVTKHAKQSESLHGTNILSYITPNTGEIDTEEDFKFLEFNLAKKNWKIHEYLQNNFGQYRA